MGDRDKMKKIKIKAFSVLFILVCLLFAACGSANSLDVLLAETWCADSPNGTVTMTFYKTGTGRVESEPATFDFQWEEIEKADNCVRLNYEFMMNNGQLKQQTTDFELKKENNIYTLVPVSGHGYTYTQESIYQKEQ